MSTSLLPSVVIAEVAEQYLPIIHLVFANLKTWLIGIHTNALATSTYKLITSTSSHFRFNRRF